MIRALISSSSQSRYKKNIEDGESDEAIFMRSLVPLKLPAGSEVVWQNPKPCSTMYCRPIQFKFRKESEFVVKNDLREMEAKIATLIPYVCDNIRVVHNLAMTMIDGKVCTYLSGARSSADERFGYYLQ